MMRYKKWVVAGFAAFLLVAAGIYLFFPEKLTVSKIEVTGCTIAAAQRLVEEETNWEKWWPEASRNGYSFRITGQFFRDFEITLRKNKEVVVTRLTFLPASTPDSIVLQWSCQLSAGLNPLKRIEQYQKAVALKKELTTVLSGLSGFLGKKENIYGADIRDEMSKDSTLLATKLITKAYPTTEEIYRLIGDLRVFIAGEHARETGFPMLHVQILRPNVQTGNENEQFETMVAIPIDRELMGNGRLFPKRFVPYKILSGEVRGGAATAEAAMLQLDQYVRDYQRTAMAIPFQSLVTERNKHSDTTRWITRVIIPVS